jgi:septum formation protein
MTRPTLILASASPRRRQLLEEAGYEFQVIEPADDVECGVCSKRGPAGLVAELAFRKALAIREQLLTDPPSAARHLPSTTILAADTVAECDGMILGKPRDEAHARAMLRRLSGRQHRVLTGLCLWRLSLPLARGEGRKKGGSFELAAETKFVSPAKDHELAATKPQLKVVITVLRMDVLSNVAIDDYLATGQWRGKAGAFGYQDRLGWVHIETGSESNVVGLPMDEVRQMLAAVDIALPPPPAE